MAVPFHSRKPVELWGKASETMRWNSPIPALLVALLPCLALVRAQQSKPALQPFEALRERAVQGDAAAQAAVAYLYEHGQGVAQDYTEAFSWYLRAAEKGDVTAQLNLGLLYFSGRGTNQDTTSGTMWIRKAAEQGQPRAQVLAAATYLDSGDYAKAFGLYRKAAEGGDDQAQEVLGSIYTSGPYSDWRKVAATDLPQGVDWLRRAVQSDNPHAEYSLASLYEAGRGVIQDYQEAARLYQLAAEQGHGDSQYALGGMYLRGRGLRASPILAYMWYNLAAAQTDSARTFPVEMCVEGRELAERVMKVLHVADGVEQAQELSRNWKPRARRTLGPSSSSGR
jgi:TPR repeat protein